MDGDTKFLGKPDPPVSACHFRLNVNEVQPLGYQIHFIILLPVIPTFVIMVDSINYCVWSHPRSQVTGRRVGEPVVFSSSSGVQMDPR